MTDVQSEQSAPYRLSDTLPAEVQARLNAVLRESGLEPISIDDLGELPASPLECGIPGWPHVDAPDDAVAGIVVDHFKRLGKRDVYQAPEVFFRTVRNALLERKSRTDVRNEVDAAFETMVKSHVFDTTVAPNVPALASWEALERPDLHQVALQAWQDGAADARRRVWDEARPILQLLGIKGANDDPPSKWSAVQRRGPLLEFGSQKWRNAIIPTVMNHAHGGIGNEFHGAADSRELMEGLAADRRQRLAFESFRYAVLGLDAAEFAYLHKLINPCPDVDNLNDRLLPVVADRTFYGLVDTVQRARYAMGITDREWALPDPPGRPIDNPTFETGNSAVDDPRHRVWSTEDRNVLAAWFGQAGLIREASNNFLTSAGYQFTPRHEPPFARSMPASRSGSHYATSTWASPTPPFEPAAIVIEVAFGAAFGGN